MFIEDARGWKWASWLIAGAMMAIGLASWIVFTFYGKPSALMVAGSVVGGLAYTEVLKREMIKLQEKLRRRRD